ncbi:MAG: LacI family DNA-binding transcriptional regulator [Bacteroidales bacterium]|nr:LacI family DNA-binding transcriptional regulator [Bacteroidales bacterium]
MRKNMPNVTLKDIAKEAGVSVALVSFVMNNRLADDGKQKYRVAESTRQRILDVARRLGYRSVNRLLQRERKPRVAGVILPDPAQEYWGRFTAELERLALPQGCTLLFGYTQEDPVRFQRLVQLFLSQQVDAMVAVPPAPDGNEELEEARRAGVPCVVPVLEEDPLAVASECAGRLLRLLNEIKTLSI